MIFRINRCTVDTAAFELRRDEAVVAVQPQVFDLLVFLLENRHRVVTKGELLIGSAPDERGEAKRSLLRALDVARKQGARALELRALTSLASHFPEWNRQLRTTRASFTEGGDTVDIRLADEVLARA